MNTHLFEVMTQHAAAVSRRGSFRMLGGAALIGALAAPASANAGKAGKNGQKRCKRQRGQCQSFLKSFCEPKGDPSACEEGGLPCCEHFARCNAGAGITCLFEGVLG